MSFSFDQLATAPCIAVFGQPAVYTPGAGAPVQLMGIFNENATVEEEDRKTGVTAVVTRPMITIRQADIPSGILPTQSEMFLVGGRYWKIVEVLPDGLGSVVIKLMRAQTA